MKERGSGCLNFSHAEGAAHRGFYRVTGAISIEQYLVEEDYGDGTEISTTGFFIFEIYALSFYQMSEQLSPFFDHAEHNEVFRDGNGKQCIRKQRKNDL